VAYSVRDILWLRMFAVAASLIAIPYFVLQPTGAGISALCHFIFPYHIMKFLAILAISTSLLTASQAMEQPSLHKTGTEYEATGIISFREDCIRI